MSKFVQSVVGLKNLKKNNPFTQQNESLTPLRTEKTEVFQSVGPVVSVVEHSRLELTAGESEIIPDTRPVVEVPEEAQVEKTERFMPLTEKHEEMQEHDRQEVDSTPEFVVPPVPVIAPSAQTEPRHIEAVMARELLLPGEPASPMTSESQPATMPEERHTEVIETAEITMQTLAEIPFQKSDEVIEGQEPTERSKIAEAGEIAAEVPDSMLDEHEKTLPLELEPDLRPQMESVEAIGPSAEVVAAYQELLVLIQGQSAEGAGVEKSHPALADEGEPVSQPKVVPSMVDIDHLDSLESQLEIHEPVSLQMVIAEVNERPLERTFKLLESYVPTAIEDEADLSMAEAVVAVKEALLPLDDDLKHENVQPELTIEVVEAALHLLDELGYEKPREVLFAYVDEHGIDALYEALLRICHDDPHYYKEEFLAQRSIYAYDSGQGRLFLTQLLGGLVIKFA